MDWIEFGSKAIEHLAWPAVVVYVLHSQRGPISELIGRIKTLEGPGGFKAEITDAAKDLKDQVKELAAKPVELPKLDAATSAIADAHELNTKPGTGASTASPTAPPSLDLAAQLAEWKRTFQAITLRDRDERLRASGKMIEAWADLEESIRWLAYLHGAKDARDAKFDSLLGQLRSQRVLSPDTLEVITGLRRLRNAVAHSTAEPNKEAADNYANVCWQIEMRIADEEAAWQTAFQQLETGGVEAAKTQK